MAKEHAPILARVRLALAQGSSGPIAVPATPTPVFSLQRDAADWSIRHAEHTFRIKDVRGLGMLAKLVEEPEREMHVLDLASEPTADAAAPIDLGDSGEIVDAQARAAYKARIRELREQVEEAERFTDTARAAHLRYELDALTDQIAGAMGLGGRVRRSGSAAPEPPGT